MPANDDIAARSVRLPSTPRPSKKRAQGKGDDDKGEEVQERSNHSLQARRRRSAPNGATNVVGAGLVVAGAAYCTVRGVVRVCMV